MRRAGPGPGPGTGAGYSKSLRSVKKSRAGCSSSLVESSSLYSRVSREREKSSSRSSSSRAHLQQEGEYPPTFPFCCSTIKLSLQGIFMWAATFSRRQFLRSGSRRSYSENAYLNQSFSLEGRSAIVSGGGTGIGQSLAMGLARAGCAVTLTGRREAPLQESCDKIRSQIKEDGLEGDPEARACYISCDVTDFSAVPDMLKESSFLTNISPTILINNAGVNVRQKAENLTSDHWDQSLHLMLTAPFMITRAMAPYMKKENYGRIINIASLQSYMAFPDSLPYAAAKSGVLGLTRALSEAYSPVQGYENVTCNAVAPGYVKTELTASVFADNERSQKLAEATLLGRNSVPEDLVGPVIFLASPAASYITGQTIPVDGGFTALGMR